MFKLQLAMSSNLLRTLIQRNYLVYLRILVATGRIVNMKTKE